MEFYENIQKPEAALLIGVDTGDFDAEASMDELRQLAETAGATVAGVMTQKRPSPDSSTYVGSGRLAEIEDFCALNEIDLIIADGELTPVQQRVIEREADVRVIDRTTLILDIFAAGAHSSEGKLQVELAQLKYVLPRLAGKGAQLSRLGGGIGTRGPGESKLESDRRHIRRRIGALEEQLKLVERRRAEHRQRRKKEGRECVAIVGYTNAGKSTLMNALTDAGVLTENKLFATLDPTARALALPDGREVTLIDTVGLIRRLPHKLVEAFKSTLEEAVQADLILNLCDASSPEAGEHLEVTLKLLDELGCAGKPVIPVLNKCDRPGAAGVDIAAPGPAVRISAVTGEGLNRLLEAIAAALPPARKRVKLLIPFSDGAVTARVRANGVVESETYGEDGICMEAVLDLFLIEKLRDYIV